MLATSCKYRKSTPLSMFNLEVWKICYFVVFPHNYARMSLSIIGTFLVKLVLFMHIFMDVLLVVKLLLKVKSKNKYFEFTNLEINVFKKL